MYTLPPLYETPACPSHGTTFLGERQTLKVDAGEMVLRECNAPVGRDGRRCNAVVAMARVK